MADEQTDDKQCRPRQLVDNHTHTLVEEMCFDSTQSKETVTKFGKERERKGGEEDGVN